MASVYVNNLVINSGSDFTQSFALDDPDTNAAYDLTGYTVSCQMRKWSGSTTAINIASQVLSPANTGRIELSLLAADTVNIKPGRYVYDVLITDVNGQKNRVIEGMVLVREGVTR